jgi:hypothetical protein
MKKFVLFAMLLGFGFGAIGQTYLLEDFSGGNMPPAGWSIDGYAAQWSINSGNQAGGAAPEAMFTWVSGNGTSRLISPEADLTGLTSVDFEFRHYLDDYSGAGYTIGVATRSGGGDWTNVWEVNPSGSIGPELVSFNIHGGDVGQADFQLCIFITGNFYNLDYWYIDDIWLFTPLDLDAAVSSITTNTYFNGPTEVTGQVKNFGSTTITDLELSWQIDEEEPTVTSFSGLSLEFGDIYDFTCDGLLELPIGSYALKVMIESVNGVDDEDPSNDMKEKVVNVVSHTVDHKPCLEEFTSSTCAPCASFNASFVPWCDDHEETITLVKYQMNWPGAGDPYYTAEGGIRRNQYGVSWVPWTNLDGTYTDNNMGAIQAMYDASILEMGLVNLAGKHTLEGTVMDIEVSMVPFTNMDNVSVYIVVFEYLTENNATTNGETEFEHVMMKMVPNATGTSVSFVDREPLTISETVDLAGTNVEEWDDLGVAVIVQDLASLYVYQSDYTIEDAEYSNDAELTQIMIDGAEMPDFSPDVYEYTIVLEEGTVEVPVVEVMTSDENAMPIVVAANALPGATTIDVFAEDMATKLTYTITFDIDTDIAETAAKAVNVFPNPTNGKVFITGVENATITVYNTAGAVMSVYNNFNAGSIDMSNFEEGIYFLNILIDNQTILNKKVSILK